MNALQISLLINYILCVFAILGMVFLERKKPIRIFVWIFVLLIPFLGLLIYTLIGYGLGIKTKLLLKKRRLNNKKYNLYITKQKNQLENDNTFSDIELQFKDLIMMNLNNANAMFTSDNNIEYFTDGPSMLESLKLDLLNAKKTINVCFYIFALDKTGKDILNILTKKASEGVKVRLLYDSIGSLFTHKYHFKKLKKAGGLINEFFPPFLGIKLFNLKANYRNHRKIVVIDGKTAYTGGMNIRNDHMGYKKKLSPWKDCHMKITGSAVYSLQNIFISDWRLSSKKPEPQNYFLNEDYFCSEVFDGKTSLQIVSSAPTGIDDENIKKAIIKMINNAKKTIYIQTPYFIPDEAFIDALKIALLCGVKVKIMVPKKPDKAFVYAATISFLKDMYSLGAEVYLYNGFLHTKAVCADDEVATIGSCNIDIRSFSLNFEVNTIIYGETNCLPYVNIFNKDLINSYKVDDDFKNFNVFQKLAILISRMFSALF